MTKFVFFIFLFFMSNQLFCNETISNSEKMMYENQIRNINEELVEAVDIISNVEIISIGFLIFITYRLIVTIIGIIMNLNDKKIPKWLDLLL